MFKCEVKLCNVERKKWLNISEISHKRPSWWNVLKWTCVRYRSPWRKKNVITLCENWYLMWKLHPFDFSSNRKITDFFLIRKWKLSLGSTSKFLWGFSRMSDLRCEMATVNRLHLFSSIFVAGQYCSLQFDLIRIRFWRAIVGYK